MKVSNIVTLLIIVAIVLIVRYYILLQYIPVKRIAPPKDGTLCSDIFDLYEDVPFISVPEKAYYAIPSSIQKKTDNGLAILSVKNDGVLEYRLNGVLVWASEDAGKVMWTPNVHIDANMLDIDESAVTQTIHSDFKLTLDPFAIHAKNANALLYASNQVTEYKRLWDLEGWESKFRPNVAHPTGFIFLISENRHMQVALLTNGDLIVLEKTSMSSPPKVKTSLLQSYCDYS
jgi:hypothetical protein